MAQAQLEPKPPPCQSSCFNTTNCTRVNGSGPRLQGSKDAALAAHVAAIRQSCMGSAGTGTATGTGIVPVLALRKAAILPAVLGTIVPAAVPAVQFRGGMKGLIS